MSRSMLYIIGEPGSGKSTLTAALTLEAANYVVMRPFGHTIWDTPAGEVVELGLRRLEFSGTDALSMSVQPKVLIHLELEMPRLVLAEGDRLANMKFFEAVQALEYDLTVVNLAPPADTLRQWRQLRNERLGKAQNDMWLRGRESKVRNLAKACHAIPIAAVTTDERLTALRAVGGPVADAFPVKVAS